MSRSVAVALGVASYGALAWLLSVMMLKVIAPRALDWINNLWARGWYTMVKIYWTVRYEEDEEGLWQIVEDRDGNRYRVQVRDSKGEMKW